jgi:hypothetical protein
MARSRAGAHPKRGWRSHCALACAEQWRIGWGQHELCRYLWVQGKTMSKMIKIRDLDGQRRRDRELTIMMRWGRRLGAVEEVLQGRPLLLLLLGPSPTAGASRQWGTRRRGTKIPDGTLEEARQDGRRGPAPGGGPRRRPLGLGGGNGNRWAEGNV